MKNAKKLLALVLALVMCVAMLAGCGGSKNPTPSQTGSAQPSASTPAEAPTYTYHTYTTALGTKWNPHNWEMNNEDTMQSFIQTPWCTMQIQDSENGIYQWVFKAATEVTDVTKDHQDDLVKYGATLPAGVTDASEVTEGYVYEIKLRDTMKWENGTPINADSYIYSMKQLLNPDMLNYRANLYYDGESAVAGGNAYYYAKTEGMYVSYANDYESIEAAIADGKDVVIDCWNFWGAQGYTDADGNEAPQYVSINDETVYGEAQGDAFSGKELWEGYAAYLDDPTSDYAAYALYYKANENYSADGLDYDATVGFYKVDDYTVRYVCQTQLSYYYFLTSCTSSFLVYEDLYEAGKDSTGTLVTTDYCTSKDTTISFGPYKMTSLQNDEQVVYTQNEEWYGYTKNEDGSLSAVTEFLVDGEHVPCYQATSIVMDVMSEDAAKQAFLKGDLDEWSVASDDLNTYGQSEKLYKVPETYTMSFFFNCSLDALKTMDTSYGNTNSVVLSNINFRKAFSLAIDRSEYVTSTAAYVPAYSLLNDLYFYDIYENPESRYRSTDQAMQAICNVYGVEYGEGTPYATLKDAYNSINGYNLTEAKELMAQAYEELSSEGIYTGGDIVIRIGYAKGSMSAADQQVITLMNKYINAATEGTGFGKIEFQGVDNIPDRYSSTAKGEFAIGYGAWGGAALYPFRNFQVYCDPDQYSIHEAGCWDPTTETLTLNINGEDVTMTWQMWSRSMVGTGAYANADFDTKLDILAAMEEHYLEFYYRIPLASTTACSMLGYKLSYYTENYNIMYDFGGLELLQFNYNDAEWAEYVASQNGALNYE